MTFELPTIAPREVFTFGDFKFTATMLSACIVTAVLILFAAIVRIFLIPKWRKDSRHMSLVRMFVELAVGLFDTNSKDMTEDYADNVGAVYFGCCAFIMTGILIELFGLRSPLSDLNCNIILGFITFFVILSIGFMKKRAKRLKHYAVIIPLVTDCVVPFSMALRLFGSVFSGYLIMDIVYQTALRNVLPVVLEPLFTLFHAGMQAYIFMFLSMNFINEALE